MVPKALEILRSYQWPEGYEVAESGEILAPWCKLRSIDDSIKKDRDYLRAWDLIREAVQVKYILDVSIFGMKRVTISGTTLGCFCADFTPFFEEVPNVESVHPTFTFTKEGTAPPYVVFDILYQNQYDLDYTLKQIHTFFPNFEEVNPRREWSLEVKRQKSELRKLLSKDGTHLRKGVIRSLRDAAFERNAGIATSGSNMRRIERMGPDMLQAFKAGIITVAPYVDTTLIKGLNGLVLTVAGDGNNRMQYEQTILNDNILRSHLVFFERFYSNVMVAVIAAEKLYDLNSLMERTNELYPGLRVGHTLFLKNVFNDRVYDHLLEQEIVI